MITKKEVEHIAKLARIGLTEKETEKTQRDLSLILDYFKVLQEIDTKKVEPTSHSILTNTSRREKIMRKDQTEKQPPELVNKIIKMAPQRRDRYIRVKAIF